MTNRQFYSTLLTVLAVIALMPYRGAHAEVTCLQITNKVVNGKSVPQLKKVKRPKKCKTGEVLAQAGPPGADGDIRIYGDGSAGAKLFSSEILTEVNAMYTDVTVSGTLSVPSGTVIRCTGSFVNNGTINVALGGAGAGSTSSAHPGISLRAAGDGQSGVNTESLLGGDGGLRLPESAAALLRYPGAAAGGGSGRSAGRQGGGALTILCKGGITNVGSIVANGQGPAAPDFLGIASASGGGGGGVVILASATAVTLASGSSISAAGGDGRPQSGGPVSPTVASGGGGGGGIVHLLAPTITMTGASIDVTGGNGGAAATLGGGLIPSSRRTAGAGGGASGGNGGDGASITANNNSVPAAQDGQDGHIITTLEDPTSLF